MSTSSCPIHFPPVPKSCLHCASYLLIGVFKDDPFENNSFEGTSDLATSIYPEIKESMHIVTSPSIAQLAKMIPSPRLKKRPRPEFIIAVGPENSFHSIMRREERDFYPERLALSPQEWPMLFAEPHYVEHLALSPIDTVSSDVASPKSKLPITTRRLGRETRKLNKEVEVVVIPDNDDKEPKETQMKRKKIATRANTNGQSSILLPHSDFSQSEPRRKRKLRSDQEADATIVAVEDPTKTQRAQVMKFPRTKALTLGPIPNLTEPPHIQRSRKRKHRPNDDSTPTSSSSGEEIIHAKACKCRDCKGKQLEKNNEDNQRTSKKRRNAIHE